MTLGFPLGLVALVALAPLLAAYFLRRRQPPRVVSALFLWRTPDQRAEAGPRFQRFSRELSLALETLAVVAAALFLGDVQCGEAARRRHVVVVVDGGLSMQARAGGKPVADRVRDGVAALAGREDAAVLTIVETGVRPTVLAGPQLERDRALSALEAWRPAQPSHDVSSALLLAKELAPSPDARIHFFTDGPLPESVVVPPQVQVRSLGQEASNAGFLSAQRRDEAGVATMTVRVASFAPEKKKVPVRFTPAEGAAQTQVVELEPGGSAVVRVGLRTTGDVRVSLPEDALPDDGQLTLLPSPLSDVSVAVFEGLDPSAQAAVRRFLKVAPGVSLEAPAALTFGPPGSTARVTLGAREPLKSFVGPFFAQKGHPLLDDVQLGGVVWTAGVNPPGRALMSAGEVVLLSEDEDGVVHLNLDVARSNVQRTVAWPVLLGNVVRQARLASPGLPRKHLMLGEDVPVVTAAGAAWVLKGPGGAERPVLGVGALLLPPATAPGRWTLFRDGKPVDALEVLPLDPRESDLRTRGKYEVDAKVNETLAALVSTRPRAWWPLLAMLGLLLLDFWLTARTPGGTAQGGGGKAPLTRPPADRSPLSQGEVPPGSAAS